MSFARRAYSALACCLLLSPFTGLAADAALVDALRSGGYVLYFRHAQTDWSQTDRNREAGWDSCDPRKAPKKRCERPDRRLILYNADKAGRDSLNPEIEVAKSRWCTTRL